MSILKILFISTFLIVLNFEVSAQFTDSEEKIDIILIDGQPSLIKMDKQGAIITEYGNVDIYFKTTLSHEQCVETFTEAYRVEIDKPERPTSKVFYAINYYTEPARLNDVFEDELFAGVNQYSFIPKISQESMIGAKSIID